MIEALLKPASVVFELSATERDEVLAEMTELIVGMNPVLSRNEIYNALVEREDKMSTLVAENVAVPHAVSSKISETIIALGISHKGVEFNPDSDSLRTAKIIFCIVFPEEKPDEHLAVLRDILKISHDTKNLENLLNSQNSLEIFDIISKAEY